jgi:membrane-associated phospholipid phosphatase
MSRHEFSPSERLSAPVPGIVSAVRSSSPARFLVLGLLYGVLTLLVALDVTRSLDVWVRDTLRPAGEWGRAQQVLNPVIDGLEPSRVLPVGLVVLLVAVMWRRSLRPLAVASLILGGAFVVTLLSKGLLGRSDPTGGSTGIAGSYPSGHVLTLVVTCGVCAVVLLGRRPTIVWLVSLGPSLTMAWALLVCSAHWATDAIGALLLGSLAVTVACHPVVSAALGGHHPPNGSEKP